MYVNVKLVGGGGEYHYPNVSSVSVNEVGTTLYGEDVQWITTFPRARYDVKVFPDVPPELSMGDAEMDPPRIH